MSDNNVRETINSRGLDMLAEGIARNCEQHGDHNPACREMNLNTLSTPFQLPNDIYQEGRPTWSRTIQTSDGKNHGVSCFADNSSGAMHCKVSPWVETRRSVGGSPALFGCSVESSFLIPVDGNDTIDVTPGDLVQPDTATNPDLGPSDLVSMADNFDGSDLDGTSDPGIADPSADIAPDIATADPGTPDSSDLGTDFGADITDTTDASGIFAGLALPLNRTESCLPTTDLSGCVFMDRVVVNPGSALEAIWTGAAITMDWLTTTGTSPFVSTTNPDLSPKSFAITFNGDGTTPTAFAGLNLIFRPDPIAGADGFGLGVWQALTPEGDEILMTVNAYAGTVGLKIDGDNCDLVWRAPYDPASSISECR